MKKLILRNLEGEHEADTEKTRYKEIWYNKIPNTVEPRYNEVGYNKILL